MKKIIVIGCPGSGKSTFSRKLSEKINIPVYHLDNLYWNPDKTTVSSEIFDQRLSEVMKKDRWIIDGNFSRTLEVRLSECDTVFFLDLPTDVCINGIEVRKGKPRPDMPWIENGESDEDFLSFVKEYNKESRPRVLALLRQYADRRIVVFHSHDEIDEFCRSFEKL